MTESNLSTAMAWSGVLRRLCNANPEFAQWLAQASPDCVSNERIHQWFEEISGQSASTAHLDIPVCKKVLRQLRKRTFFLLMVRDLSGLADLDEVVGAMTALADLCVEQSYRSVLKDMLPLHGTPRDPANGLPQEMIIIGMGKLGGCELNVSSDIDLVMLYGEEGETDGPRPISHHEFYARLTRKMMPILSEADADGQVFRTDLRLRPDGESGPVAWSLDAFEQYLFTQGREWERYAWLKARVIPARAFEQSEPAASLQHAESLRIPFVYRKYFDFDALAALRSLRERIRQDWQRKVLARPGVDSQHNIKLGEGGIREIEFVVQLSQLIRGGRMPALQQRGLLSALEAQRRAGILSEENADKLVEAYCFLRRVEHALQYAEDAQTHLLPQTADGMAALAAAMRMSSEDFNQTLSQHRDFVERTFCDAFRIAGIADDTPSNGASSIQTSHLSASIVNDRSVALSGSALEQEIAQFGDQAATLTTRVESFLDGHRIRGLSTTSRNRIDTLLPIALHAARQTKQEMVTALRLLDLIEAISQRSAYVALLAEYPETLARIARMIAASPWAAQYLIQNPVVLDSLIAWRALMEPIDYVRVAASMRADLDACLLPDGSADVEQQMNMMRDTQRQLSFQLLAQDLEGALSVESLGDQLSALADMLLHETLNRVWPLVTKPNGDGVLPPMRLAIIAYGRLGGKELGYSSDLDLVYLYDDTRDDATELYAKLGRRMSSWLSTMTSSGRLYEIDLRLRPDGDAGLLAVSVEAFQTYQLEKAWPWEHQAITRARFAAGDPSVGLRFEHIREAVLKLDREPVTFAQEVRDMRKKMTAGHPNTSKDFDIKHDPGGMVDLEFVTQYLVLTQASRHASLIGNLGNIALLRLSGEAGLIHADLAARAGNAYRNLRRAQHQLRLQGADKARVPQDQLVPDRQAVRELWETVLGMG
ncbi:MAG: bifunctional [glutamate--ammonia ligase]-adenylyl-L-tyrosine phosphorylase/[glutamate--ammonia-ligase] adenylyltransferase [Zwartia sp.]|nr:bifunctional [glutamate--ammonia ligase]-adenylyl-L-tyrosine phosphorylase/[glutamate--ammonia-ligase] adenylyltransferase [Zwartia sp.]MDO9025335.1 bifunctional [glutamate--ammonia ligase]-adenylyl-L-tyrosine phosphorylase/[glutamate--ammonia-ligase] adenylyltransferase [Zwartia sp.]